MTYPLRQLQFTADHVISRCTYKSNGSPLNSADKKYLATFLLNQLEAFSRRNGKNIVIHPNNPLFKLFFEVLANDSIVFPSNTGYLLLRSGITYESQGNEKKEIFNHRKSKDKASIRQQKEILQALADELSALALVSDDVVFVAKSSGEASGSCVKSVSVDPSPTLNPCVSDDDEIPALNISNFTPFKNATKHQPFIQTASLPPDLADETAFPSLVSSKLQKGKSRRSTIF